MSKQRRDRIRERLPELGADAMLVTKLVNVRYLTGFSGSAGAVLVGAQDVLFTDSRYDEQSAREVPDVRRVIPAPGQEKVMAGQISSAGITKLAIEAAHVTLAQAKQWREDMPSVELVETKDVVEELRKVKDAAEVEALRKAAAIGDRGLAELLGRLREALAATRLPVIEVHISNIHAREPFRRLSLVSGVANGVIAGLGVNGYTLALEAIAGMVGVPQKGAE